MKQYIYLICALCTLCGFTSCERELEVYSEPTCRLNFIYENVETRAQFDEKFATTSYSFVYGPSNLTNDTLWFEVETMGFVSDKDRAVSLVQVSTGENDAVPGKHYVAFNDPSLASKYVIPAGKARAKLPIVLLRDASLLTETVTLRFSIQDNDYFVQGYPEFQTRTLVFTDQLAEPSKWTAPLSMAYVYGGRTYYYTTYFYYYFGNYGVVKHRFLIEKTGKAWDDDYIEELMGGDSNYIDYIQKKVTKLLEEENAHRQAQGLDVLKEADGTVVDFNDGNPY